MARQFFTHPPSLQRYFAFLILVVGAAVVSLIIYVVSERRLLSRQGPNSVEQLQGRLDKKSVFFQKIEQAVGGLDKNPTHKLPQHRLDGVIGDASRQGDKSEKSNLEAGKMAEKKDDSRQGLESGLQAPLNYNVHLFYYPWYGAPGTDGQYLHWNHQYIPHWRKEEAGKWPTGVHVPPDDIGANFYPALGPYSSADPEVVDKHMRQIRLSGAGVIVVSWYPPDQADENGKPFDSLIPLLLDTAHKYGVKVAIHIEPYKDRSGETLHRHVKYIVDSYGRHPAYFRREVQGKQLPVYYIYDSYQIDSASWAEALKPSGKHCLRNTKYDGVFLGLYLGPEDEKKLLAAGFDGFYTYFASNGFTKGSSWSNWKDIAKFAAENSLLFVPSVGPGYVDTRVRPWNDKTTRKRLHGKYFRQAFQAALDAKPDMISVTSFNEWHEGTQVEPAVPKIFDGYKYEDYSPGNPEFYLLLLKEYVDKFTQLPQ